MPTTAPTTHPVYATTVFVIHDAVLENADTGYGSYGPGSSEYTAPVETAVSAVVRNAVGPPTSWIGDGSCDPELNSEEYEFDKGDCCEVTCVPSLYGCRGGFDCKDVAVNQNGCPAELQVLVGNGQCDVGHVDDEGRVVNTAVCQYDGGDCCGNALEMGWHHCTDPSSALLKDGCHVSKPQNLGNGKCDPAPYNTQECNWDGGDCCQETCSGATCGEGDGVKSDDPEDPGVAAFPHCSNPEYLYEASCTVEFLENLGDGWCDQDLSGYNTLECSYDGGDCCVETCTGALCGQNGWNCLEPQMASSAEEASSAGRQRRQTEASEERRRGTAVLSPLRRRANGAEVQYDTIEQIVTDSCGAELAACFNDDTCGYLFMIGSVSLASDILQDLLRCIQDFDDANLFKPSTLLFGDDANYLLGQCTVSWCRTEYLRCQVSMDCFLGIGNDGTIRQELDDCVNLNCVMSAIPTPSPTLHPIIMDKEAGLFVTVDGDRLLEIDFKHVVVGDVETVPIGDVLEGGILVTISCDPTSGGTADIEDRVVIIKRGLCNVYETVRMAALHGAQVLPPPPCSHSFVSLDH
jgi:hypothetical protein